MGTPRLAAPADSITTSTHPREGPCVRPKGPSGASRGLESGHSIPIGDRAVGPPRSGFVLRLCIRKADEAGVRPCSATALRIQDSAEHVVRCRWFHIHCREHLQATATLASLS